MCEVWVRGGGEDWCEGGCVCGGDSLVKVRWCAGEGEVGEEG